VTVHLVFAEPVTGSDLPNSSLRPTRALQNPRLLMTVRYKLGCDLSYEIKSPTTFIFNLEVARVLRHQDIVERLTVTPDLARRTYTVPDINNRYFSIDAKPGPLNVHYEAEVTLYVFRAEPAAVRELPLSEIPLDIMPFLLPSRFVPSDRLAAFAEKEFGRLPKGHQRVTAICNWIYDQIDYKREPRTSRRLRRRACWEQRVMEGDPKFQASQDIPNVPYHRFAELIGM
jgi:transglutaminase-like putative cysteine protease